MKHFISALLLGCILLTMVGQPCLAAPTVSCCCPKAACHCDSNNVNFKKSCGSDSEVSPVPWSYSTQKPITFKNYEVSLLPSQNLFPQFFHQSIELAFHPRPWLVPPNESPQARLNIWLI